jgi:hypothetical protein
MLPPILPPSLSGYESIQQMACLLKFERSIYPVLLQVVLVQSSGGNSEAVNVFTKSIGLFKSPFAFFE